MFPNGWNFVKYGVNPEYTEETRKKMSTSAKNKDPEVFKRMAETKKRQYKEHPESHPFIGRKHSEETINKMK